MKVRNNKHRVLAKLAHNKYSEWIIAPIIRRSLKIAETNRRIKEMVDKRFPEVA